MMIALLIRRRATGDTRNYVYGSQVEFLGQPQHGVREDGFQNTPSDSKVYPSRPLLGL